MNKNEKTFFIIGTTLVVVGLIGIKRDLKRKALEKRLHREREIKAENFAALMELTDINTSTKEKIEALKFWDIVASNR